MPQFKVTGEFPTMLDEDGGIVNYALSAEVKAFTEQQAVEHFMKMKPRQSDDGKWMNPALAARFTVKRIEIKKPAGMSDEEFLK